MDIFVLFTEILHYRWLHCFIISWINNLGFTSFPSFVTRCRLSEYAVLKQRCSWWHPSHCFIVCSCRFKSNKKQAFLSWLGDTAIPSVHWCLNTLPQANYKCQSSLNCLSFTQLLSVPQTPVCISVLLCVVGVSNSFKMLLSLLFLHVHSDQFHKAGRPEFSWWATQHPPANIHSLTMA